MFVCPLGGRPPCLNDGESVRRGEETVAEAGVDSGAEHEVEVRVEDDEDVPQFVSLFPIVRYLINLI
jgi:hypothetical protein